MRKVQLFTWVFFLLPVTVPVTVNEDYWSGTVSFYEKRTGGEIIISDWRIDAVITNNRGRATHKMASETKNGAVGNCLGEGEAELDVGIDEEKNTYSIFVTIPDCIGRSRTAAGTEYDFVQDNSIAIYDRHLGANRKVLSGFQQIRDTPAPGHITITTYTWSLTRK